MIRYKTLSSIDDIGDVEGNFIVELAAGISGFINTIDSKLNKMKASHLSFIDNLNNSDLISDINKSDFTKELFDSVKKEEVYKVSKSKTFYDTNDFYISGLRDLLKNEDYLEETINRIKRFRTKEKLRISVKGPNTDTLDIDKTLEDIKSKSEHVFDAKDTSEYALVGKYFGNVKTIHSNIDDMKSLDSVVNDVYLHNMVTNVDRFSKELKKLIKLLDTTSSIVSRDAMESIMLDVRVCADFVTAISNLYYLHISSITSLVSLKNL